MPLVLLYLLSFIALLFLFLVLALTSLPKGRGISGEKTLSYFLGKLNSNEYTTINDVILEHNETTSQIDHIVVSQYGVFIIETKTWSGSVYAARTSPY